MIRAMTDFSCAESFVDHVLTRLYEDVHTAVTDNYDRGRFSYDGVDRSRSTYFELHIAALKALLRHSDALFRTYTLLEENESKKLFIELLRYRLSGHKHVKLSTNTPAYWEKDRQSIAMPWTPSALGIKNIVGGDLQHREFAFEGKTIKLDGGSGSVLWPFLLKQYFFERGGVRIRPEPGDHVIDAGSCLGDTSLALGCSAGPEGRVYLFEMLDAHLKASAFNIAQNPGLAHFKTFACGLSDTVFTPPQKPPVEGRYLPGFNLPANNDVFPTTTLDCLVASGEIPRVDFIKMDIEGSELKALHGAEKTLRRFKPRLAISLYHDVNHFYSIPLFLVSLGLGYRFHLAHYTIHAGETILYAAADAKASAPVQGA